MINLNKVLSLVIVVGLSLSSRGQDSLYLCAGTTVVKTISKTDVDSIGVNSTNDSLFFYSGGEAFYKHKRSLIDSVLFADPNFQVLNNSLQVRLNGGETPKQIYDSNPNLLPYLYGRKYQGGLIFYFNTETGAGIVAAEFDQSNHINWGCPELFISGNSGTRVGTGEQNTMAILTECENNDGLATHLCDTLTLNSYTDWFLPSTGELVEMNDKLHKQGLGGFDVETYGSSGGYWSSNQINYIYAYYFDFKTGELSWTHKRRYSAYLNLRAVRSFDDVNSGVPVQTRLNNGEKPIDIYNSEHGLLESMYGMLYQDGLLYHLDTITGDGHVCAPANYTDRSDGFAEEYEWATDDGAYIQIGNTDSLIGGGEANTFRIVDALGKSPYDYAAYHCTIYETENHKDWFLPTPGDAVLLSQNLDQYQYGGFKSSEQYWTSYEYNGYGGQFAYYFTIYAGEVKFAKKNYEKKVRPIRKFYNTPPTAQERLDAGQSPISMYRNGAFPLDSIYGKSYKGGLLFYLNLSDGSGLICAKNDQSEGVTWGCDSTVFSGAVRTYVGSGQINTNDILRDCASENNAAKLCDDYVAEGYDDWYLPSEDELNQLYRNIGIKMLSARFSEALYWSSSKFDNLSYNGAVVIYFATTPLNASVWNERTTLNRVRAVRAFR